MPEGSAAPFRRIAQKLRDAILRGYYKSGQKMPSIRDLAVREAVNPHTVHEAYRLLEKEGWLRSVEGSGTFASPEAVLSRLRKRRLKRMLLDARLAARKGGLSESEWQQILEDITRRVKLQS